MWWGNQGNFAKNSKTMIGIPQENFTFIWFLGKGGCEPRRNLLGMVQFARI